MANKRVNFDERYDEIERVNEELAAYSEKLGLDVACPVRVTTTSTRAEGLKAEVNWCAFGAVTPETAYAFSKLLVRAAELAASFKYNGYELLMIRA